MSPRFNERMVQRENQSATNPCCELKPSPWCRHLQIQLSLIDCLYPAVLGLHLASCMLMSARTYGRFRTGLTLVSRLCVDAITLARLVSRAQLYAIDPEPLACSIIKRNSPADHAPAITREALNGTGRHGWRMNGAACRTPAALCHKQPRGPGQPQNSETPS